MKLGSLEVEDSLALATFGAEGMVTLGHAHAEVDWTAMWRERLTQGGKLQPAPGWRSKMALDAYVVNMYDAAGQWHNE